MSDDLVKRLRDPAWVKHWHDQVGFQAADRIEKLEAERDALQANLDKAMQVVEMIASADVDAVLGKAVDLSCEILGELMDD